MMKRDEFGVLMSARPAPISSVNDLLIPAFALFVAWVLSTICASAKEARNMTAPATTQTKNDIVDQNKSQGAPRR